MSSETENYILRLAEEQDTPFLFELFCEGRRDEFAPLHLTAEALEPLLRMQFAARDTGYARQFPKAKKWVAFADGRPLGTTTVNYESGAIHLLDIAVSRISQRKGLGTWLLGGLLEQARDRDLPLRLNVRFDNPALRLYERMGFVRTGEDGLNIAMELRFDAVRKQGSDHEHGHDEGRSAEAMSSRWFRRLLGSTAKARGLDGTELELTVRSMSMMPTFGTGVAPRDSFTVEFSGPMAPLLPSAMTTMTFNDGEEMELFISPVGPEAGRMRYEAVFNRMQRLAVQEA